MGKRKAYSFGYKVKCACPGLIVKVEGEERLCIPMPFSYTERDLYESRAWNTDEFILHATMKILRKRYLSKEGLRLLQAVLRAFSMMIDEVNKICEREHRLPDVPERVLFVRKF